MSSSIHVLIEYEITIICEVYHLLIYMLYLENCISEIENFDFVINIEIYV